MTNLSSTVFRYLLSMSLIFGCGSLTAGEALGVPEPEEEEVPGEDPYADDERYQQAGSPDLNQDEQADEIQLLLTVQPGEEEQENDINELQKSALAILSNGGKVKVSKKSNMTSILDASTAFMTTHPGAVHTLKTYGILGDTLVLEDDAIWAVRPSDQNKCLFSWLDPFDANFVIITLNHELFSSYVFRLHNQTTGQSVAANLRLFLTLPYHSIYNHHVVAFDDVLKMIWLEDGSVWSVMSCDYSTQWQIGHTVIIGVNDGWFSSSRPNILINADLLNVVRANCIN